MIPKKTLRDFIRTEFQIRTVRPEVIEFLDSEAKEYIRILFSRALFLARRAGRKSPNKEDLLLVLSQIRKFF